MATITVSLPDAMETWVEQRSIEAGYANASDYVRDLICRDQARVEAVARMQGLVDEGLRSEEGSRSMAEIKTEARRRADYEALQATDVQTYDEMRQILDEGRDELIPEPFASRLMDRAEHPLTVFRELRGITSAELARASGVNQAQIQDIEAGRATGSARTVAALAQALGIDVSDLTA